MALFLMQKWEQMQDRVTDWTGLLSNLSHIRGEVGDMSPASIAAAVVVGLRAVHVMNRLIDTALQEVLLSQTRFANFLLLFAAGSGIHVASKYRETITQHLNVTRGAASFDSAERAEWLVQLIHNLKRLPPNFWYSSAATGLLSLQIAQRLGVWCLQKTARSRIGNYILKSVFIAVFLATFRSELLAEAQVKWLRDRTQSLMASNRSQDSLQDRARAATGAAFRSV
ncbi:unnamed protein product [Cladocopium goreaui]|uniref:Uncharacterized protein n=1 Tax=Cladocopium goreaui TaxID=2562237 RepID=A0A9P1C5W1_9DINO|nr:unnamed protein product [Cladocopium goreaui]